MSQAAGTEALHVGQPSWPSEHVAAHGSSALERRPRAEDDDVRAAIGDGLPERNRLEHRPIDQPPSPVGKPCMA